MSTSDNLLRDMRQLHAEMAAISPTVQQVLQFRDWFVELDNYLSNGGVFPRDWITQKDRVQLTASQFTAGIDTTDPDETEDPGENG